MDEILDIFRHDGVVVFWVVGGMAVVAEVLETVTTHDSLKNICCTGEYKCNAYHNKNIPIQIPRQHPAD